MRTNRPSKYSTASLSPVSESFYVRPLQIAVLPAKEIKNIRIYVGSDQYPASQKDLDYISNELLLLNCFDSVRVEKQHRRMMSRPPDIRPWVCGIGASADMCQTIADIIIARPFAIIWVLIGDNKCLASEYVITTCQQYIEQYLINNLHLPCGGLLVTNHLIEFHCDK